MKGCVDWSMVCWYTAVSLNTTCLKAGGLLPYDWVLLIHLGRYMPYTQLYDWVLLIHLALYMEVFLLYAELSSLYAEVLPIYAGNRPLLAGYQPINVCANIRVKTCFMLFYLIK